MSAALAATLAQAAPSVADAGGLPYAVVDKQTARMNVHFGDGRLAGSTPVLLGRVGHQATPAGRFPSEPGRNLDGESIVWIDYDQALAIHRLRPGPARERRAERMRSPDAREHRISAGCVVVPQAFYDSVVQPVMGHGRTVVYVLADNR